MDISTIPNETWTDLVLGKINLQFEFLAVKILLARLRMKAIQDQSAPTINSCVQEFKDYLTKMAQYPAVQKDVEKIIAVRGVS